MALLHYDEWPENEGKLSPDKPPQPDQQATAQSIGR